MNVQFSTDVRAYHLCKGSKWILYMFGVLLFLETLSLGYLSKPTARKCMQHLGALALWASHLTALWDCTHVKVGGSRAFVASKSSQLVGTAMNGSQKLHRLRACTAAVSRHDAPKLRRWR